MGLVDEVVDYRAELEILELELLLQSVDLLIHFIFHFLDELC